MVFSAIHIGVPRQYLEKVANLVFLNPGLSYAVDNDGFASWGEPRGTDANDSNTFHVVIKTADVDAAVDTIRKVFDNGNLLNTFYASMNDEAREHKQSWSSEIVVVTDPDDWSVTTMSYTSLKDEVPTIPSVPEFKTWAEFYEKNPHVDHDNLSPAMSAGEKVVVRVHNMNWKFRTKPIYS